MKGRVPGDSHDFQRGFLLPRRKSCFCFAPSLASRKLARDPCECLRPKELADLSETRHRSSPLRFLIASSLA
jgi:hypothetical protein